ncbi:class A beta-lactamase, subclass A2 [Reichenbachiella versicolor]|uniref:class A beta-lactamase, subclass A2 n=1 Tax=Reichenbachiella versicolor TaxID=1821036 RepID=UPI000D6E4502|nr:class A beta-lactamase, subclass A2 [Reichenbachiella versicolor]
MKNLPIILLLFAFACSQAPLSKMDPLKKEIQNTLKDKDATVGVSIIGPSSLDTLSINGDLHLPMQSVYKFHLAAAVLHRVDQGELNLSDTIEITKEQLDNPLWSVIRKDYPNGGKLSLGQVIKYTVAVSDNVGCDLLFEMIGGPSVAQEYMNKIGITDIAILHNEETMQSEWSIQYLNWTTAKSATKVLKTLYENKDNLLSTASHQFLWDVMKSSWVGKLSMKTYLPETTVIAHKTGHSGKNEEGLTAAQNEIGIIWLPNGDYFYISILVSDSSEESEVNRKLLADITKLTWDYFNDK